ncbi:MAG: alpha-amylase, partial [Acidimicrobiia bacterium]|nr:alpha-amylase [Acidimicrobiia bacterium]
AEVREGVIQTILHVARKFPIIRFDAAMTLAKRHIRRLWFPAPGEGGAIPSRSLHGLTEAEFEAAIPEEFWREVVDRVAAEVPDTLLLAEAFWMMEGYFVRTLGMHRVYNSAFMHMMSQETNAEYRELMRNVLEFDPEILKRFVNFMNNPDEETAIAQFGKDGKYFGVATVMATMPGLPMFGHGQVEGYSEKYGMEFRRPRWDEHPDGWLVDRHRREIFPLLHRRWQFAEVANFLLYDLVAPEGHVNGDVYAYSNNVDGAASLVLFNNRWGDAVGRIHWSLEYRDKGAGKMNSRTLADGLGIGEGEWVVFREHVSGLEHIRPTSDFTDGLDLRLGAFEYRVYLDFRQVSGPQYAEVARRLEGNGTPSVDGEIEALRLEPARNAVADVVAAAIEGDDLDGPVQALVSVGSELGLEIEVSAADLEKALTNLVEIPDVEPLLPEAWRRGVAAAAVLLGGVEPAVAEVGAGWAFERVSEQPPSPALLQVAMRPFDERPEGASRLPTVGQSAKLLLGSWSEDWVVRSLVGVNEHDGVEWFDRDAYHQLVTAMLVTGSLRSTSKRARDRLVRFITVLAGAPDDTDYRWDRLTG